MKGNASDLTPSYNIAHTMPETTAQNRLYIYEPNLIMQITQLVCYDNHIPIVSSSSIYFYIANKR